MTTIQLTIKLQANLNEHQQEQLCLLLEQNAKRTAMEWVHVEQQRAWIQAEAESHLET
jgi:hypothetical protein